MSAVFSPGGPGFLKGTFGDSMRLFAGSSGLTGAQSTERAEQFNASRREFTAMHAKAKRLAGLDPALLEASETRRRIAKRGGAQSTLLGTSAPALSQSNVFKGNLGGTGRR